MVFGNVLTTNTAFAGIGSVFSVGARDELGLQVLRLLNSTLSLAQRKLAAELGVLLYGVNYSQKALVAWRFVNA